MTREEIEKRAEEWVDSYPQLDSCTYTQDDVDMMMRNSFVEGADWMQDKYSNKISELTEQLDASHIFCEGVKEHYIEKACREFCHNCTHEENCEAHCYRYKHFFESMKGE